MKSKFLMILSLVTFLNPMTVMALGESKRSSEMNPVSIKCTKAALKEWSKENRDAKIEEVIRDAKRAGNAS